MHSIHIHLANLLITSLLITFLIGLFIIIKNSSNSKVYKIFLLVSMILSHIQLIFGGLNWWHLYSQIDSFSMGDEVARIRLIEHPIIMVFSVILISYSYILFKKKPDSIKIKYMITSLYAIAIFLILFIVHRMTGNLFPW